MKRISIPLIKIWSSLSHSKRTFSDMLELGRINTEKNIRLFQPKEFNEEWMGNWKKYIYNIIDDELLLRPFDSSYDDQLINESMQTLLELLNGCSTLPPSNQMYEEVLKPHVENIARACGIHVQLYEQFKLNFDEFVELYSSRRDYIKTNAIEEIEMNNAATDEFRGSSDHLIFGKMVGDALGLHPVWGAMLNPTGGVSGPSNSNIFVRSLNIVPSIRKNTVLHDATGYLRLYHGIGPGYRYLSMGDIEGRLDSSNGVLNGFWLPRADYVKNFFWKMEGLEYMSIIKGPDLTMTILHYFYLLVIVLCFFVLLSQIM